MGLFNTYKLREVQAANNELKARIAMLEAGAPSEPSANFQNLRAQLSSANVALSDSKRELADARALLKAATEARQLDVAAAAVRIFSAQCHPPLAISGNADDPASSEGAKRGGTGRERMLGAIKRRLHILNAVKQYN